MTAWSPVADPLLDVEQPARSLDMIGIRDNAAALVERAAGAPWLNGFGAEEILTIGSSSPWTVPAGVTRVEVTIIGAGGGGGGAADTGIVKKDMAGGGGAGGFCTGVIPATPLGTIVFTVAAGGAGGVAASGNGVAGTTTEFLGSSVLRSLGGAGGQGASTISNPGGVGGASSGSGRQFFATGGDGGDSVISNNGNFGFSGAGGGSAVVQGMPGVNTPGVGVSASAESHGAGGGGATAHNTGSFAGGDGGDGLIILRY